MIFRKKEPNERITYGMHFSDWLVILLAALLTAAAVYLLVTPENFGAEFAKAARVMTAPGAPPAQQSTPGEAPVMIFKDDKKK